MSNNQRVKIDIVLCGDVRVGKTSFVLRATGKKVSKKYIQTIGIDYGVYRCYTGGKNVTLNMWDMSGDSRYDLIAKSFFEIAHCILFCFDFTRQTTFQKIKQLVDKADEYNKNHKKCILGLKSDLVNNVNVKQVKEYAKTINASYYELSTLDEVQTILVMHSIAGDGVKSGIYTECEENEEEIIDTTGCCYM